MYKSSFFVVNVGAISSRLTCTYHLIIALEENQVFVYLSVRFSKSLALNVCLATETAVVETLLLYKQPPINQPVFCL